MKKTKGYYLRLWKNIGLIVIVLGAIVALLNEIAGAIIVLIGLLIESFCYLMGKRVYVCPECKAQFEKVKDKIILQTSGRQSTHWALLTCPECKKTNWCKAKLVSEEEL